MIVHRPVNVDAANNYFNVFLGLRNPVASDVLAARSLADPSTSKLCTRTLLQ